MGKEPTMNRNDGKRWESSDLYLVAALRCRGHELLEIRKGERRATFILKDSPSLQEDVRAYFTRKLRLEALAYAGSIKDTKAAIFNT
jgi:hypothetical protein